MIPAPDYAETARRVNARLARRPAPGSMAREWLNAEWVGRVLSGETFYQAFMYDLIREIAAELAREKGVAK